MTLLSGLELGVAVCLSVSPDSSRWRALRAARSLMALGVNGESLSAATLAAPLAPPLLPLPLDPRSDTSPELPAAGSIKQKTDVAARTQIKKTRRLCVFVLTCQRRPAQLAGGGARCGGRLVELQLSLHWELWDGERQLVTPWTPHRTRTQQAGTLTTSCRT